MRKNFKNKKIKFVIGDIRDQKSIEQAVIGVDYIFHAAALKQVPSCEFYPMEAVKTNILGIDNLLNEAIKNNVKKIICLSTDKAVYPINAMGVSKSMMEKVIVARSRISNKTKICITRYGNVIYSRGSVIPLFIKLLHEKKALTVTNFNMTRFLMSMSEAINLVMFAFKNGKNGDIFVRKSPAATIKTLMDAIGKIYKKKIMVKKIGVRHGEKTHETLLTKEELKQSKEYKEYFKIVSDNRDLNYEKYYSNGKKSSQKIEDYTSENTKRLDVTQTAKIIKNIIKNKDFIN